MKDTSPEAAKMQIEVQRRMTGEQRLRMAFEMSMLARDLLRARIQQEHPDWSQDERNHEFLRCTLAPESVPASLR